MAVIFGLTLCALAVLFSWPLSRLMAWCMSEPAASSGLRFRLEAVLLRFGGAGVLQSQNWRRYIFSLLLCNCMAFVLGFLILGLQQNLPLNPDAKSSLDLSLIFNIVASFISNTDLQHYSGEVSLSYFSQIFGLMWLQFISAATGISVLAAISRALSGQALVGNFYTDLVRAIFFILLPLSFLVSVLLLLGGVVMTFEGTAVATTIEGAQQYIARGPLAVFVAIKQLGTNGGGFFGANSAHPFENPSWFTNSVEFICILLLPMASVWMFGRITGRMRHAAVIFCVMLFMFFIGLAGTLYLESMPAPALLNEQIEQAGNLEGKEMRFGQSAASFWAVATTASSNGSTNAALESFNPLSALIPLSNMWLNVIFGGVGVGVLNIFLYMIVGVFISGMMVGRTPEYLNRKVETKEMRLALLAILLHPLLILGCSAIFIATGWGMASTGSPGMHGFTEILYEFTSAAANNGSSFSGLNNNSIHWNIFTGFSMLLARFIGIILPLAIAGALAVKNKSPETAGTLRTDTPLFGLVILGSIILIGALLFLPVSVLGPVAEQLSAAVN